MTTKLFTLLLALAASVGTLFAESGTCGDNLTWDLTDGVLTISGTGAMTDWDDWNGDSKAPWYKYRQGITSVTIGNSVTSIGSWAFRECSSLTSITIPNSVTSIGNLAFYECIGLTSVTIPSSVTSIGNEAFGNCTGLTSITIPNSVTSIGNGAFSGCSSLTSHVYNAHVFAYLPASYSGAYTIPDGIESIAGAAFRGCAGLTSVTIPNSVTSIGGWAFFECTGLTSVTIPNSVTSIGNGAFLGCNSLTSVTIPNSVTSLENETFSWCTGLTSIIIPNSVTRIGDFAFWNCTGLTSITCEATNPPTCGDNAFYAVPQSIPLYVPFGSEDAYRIAAVWKDFTNIQPIADNVDITTVEVVPDETSVNIAWPKISGAYTYELVIKDKSGKIVCTLVFDAEGRLLSIAFNAPARDNMPQQTHVAGFAFTVTGLNSGTTYNYSIASKDSNGNTLNTESGSFTTTGEGSGLQNVTHQPDETKFFRNGQLLILRGNELFNAQGARVE